MFVVRDRQIRRQALGSGDPGRAGAAKIVAGKVGLAQTPPRTGAASRTKVKVSHRSEPRLQGD